MPAIHGVPKAKKKFDHTPVTQEQQEAIDNPPKPGEDTLLPEASVETNVVEEAYDIYPEAEAVGDMPQAIVRDSDDWQTAIAYLPNILEVIN